MAFIDLPGLDDVEFTYRNGKGPYEGDDPAAIRIVGLTQCGVCHLVERKLTDEGVPFGYVDLDTLPQGVRGTFLRGLKAQAPAGGLIFPVLITQEGACVVGFHKERWAEAGVSIEV